MRIAYVCTDPGVPIFGCKGGSIHVQSVLRALLTRQANPVVFARRVGGEPPDDLRSIPVVRLDRPPSRETEPRERFLLAQNDVIDTVLSRHGPFDAVYERHALWSFAAMEYAARAGIPGLLEVNAPLVEEQRQYRDLVNEGPARIAADRAFRSASAVLAVSESLATRLRAEIDDEAKIRVIPNGVDCDRFAARVHRAGPPTIGFVGSLRPWHGAEQLLEAFLRLMAHGVDARLLVVGDGPLMPWLERRSARTAGSVELAGAVPPALVPEYLSRTDIAVAPYPSLPGFYFSPLKLFEYMAAGCAIVASEIGQVSEVLDNGRTGLLYEPDDLEGLTDRLATLAGDAGLRGRLGTAAKLDAHRSHTWLGVADRILALAGAEGVTA